MYLKKRKLDVFAIGRRGGHVHIGNDTILKSFDYFEKDKKKKGIINNINIITEQENKIINKKDHTLTHLLSDGFSTRLVYEKNK